LRESANREREKSQVEQERLAKLTIDDLIDVFEEFADPFVRTMDVVEFKNAVRKNPRLVVNGGKPNELESRADACFREIDHCHSHRISLPEFVVGVLKLTRVKPQPEFITQEDHQHRVLRTTKKVSDCYKAASAISSRYVDDFKEQTQGLQESCMKMKEMLDEVPKDPAGDDAPQPEDQLDAVTASGSTRLEKQLEARYSFISRLRKLEDKIQQPAAERQMWKDDKICEHLHPLMESILHEDVLPWVRDQMPAIQESWRKQAAAEGAAERKAPRAKAKSEAPPMSAMPSTQKDVKGMGSAPPMSAMPSTQKDVEGMGSALPSSALRAFKPGVN